MCLICIDLDRKKLTPWEAAQNRLEMLDQFDEEHLIILDEKIRASVLEYLNNLDQNDEI